MHFTRSINQHGWKDHGQHGFRPMYQYNCSDDFFTAEIFQIWNPRDDWFYIIKLSFDERKEIANSIERKGGHKTLKSAKQMVEKLIGLLHRANSNNELWIAKGIMLGFTDLDQMEHLKETIK